MACGENNILNTKYIGHVGGGSAVSENETRIWLSGGESSAAAVRGYCQPGG